MKLVLLAPDDTIKLRGVMPPSDNPDAILFGSDVYVFAPVQPDPAKLRFYVPARRVLRVEKRPSAESAQETKMEERHG